MIKVFTTPVAFCYFVLFAGALSAEKATAGPLPAAGSMAPMDVAPSVKLESEDARLFQAVNDSFDIRSSSVQTLTFAKRSESSLTTAIVVDGDTWTLELQKHSVRSPDFEAWIQDASGRLTLVEPPPAQTYVGTVLELPGSEVRASYNDGEIEAVVYTSDGVFGIQPLTGAGIATQNGDHAVYRDSEWVNRAGYTCATNVGQHLFDGMADLEEPQGDVPDTAMVAFDLAQIALDADFEFFQLNASNVNSTILDMENVINGLETIYENQLNITFDVSSVVVRTALSDPYSATDPSTLLGQLVSHWNASPQSAVQRDLFHLFTGKNLDGSVIGIAYVGAVCNQNWAYGLSQSRFTVSMTSRVALSAHEIGHNWNAQHCNGCTACADCCRIMCSGLGGCSGILTSFGCQAASQMAAFRDTRTCLGTAPYDECTINADCDDNNVCTSDVCSSGACSNPPSPNGAACGSSTITDCDNPDTCSNGICVTNPDPNGTLCADDGDPCTNDTCNGTGSCTHLNRPNGTSCNDGNPCTTADTCTSGACAGTPVNCDDARVCTTDSCVNGVCQYAYNTLACDDGNLCSTNDRCANGLCSGTPLNCDDDNPCTADSCSGGVCQHASCPTSSFCSAVICDPVEGCIFDHECISTTGNPCPDPATCHEGTNTCGGCNQPTVVAAGSRYLNVTPASQGSTPVALIVTGDCQDPNAACVYQYVQSKCNGGANDGLNCDTDADCPKQCVGGQFPNRDCTIATDCPQGECAGRCDIGTLGATPYYKTAAQWGTAKVRGAQIRPETTYSVHTECDFPGGPVLSSAANAKTWRWGDVDNNGSVNALDVSNLVNAFKGLYGPFTFEQMNLYGCVPDDVLNALDITLDVDAVRGLAYPCSVVCP